MKPNWKDAPKWAKWVAMDADNEWYWYEQKPLPKDDFWQWDNGNGRAQRIAPANWRESLEQRPEVQL